MPNSHIKKLSLTDCIMLIMGSMIGSGIFIVPAVMSSELQSPFMLIMAWVVTGIITIFAALNYGELAAQMPLAGGQYVYLKEAYGKLIGFLYGWTFFTVIQTGTIAAVAVAFSIYAGVFFPAINDTNQLFYIGTFSVSSKQVLAIGVVWFLTLSNFRGIKTGAYIQNTFTATKIMALLFMIGVGVYYISTHEAVAVDWSLPPNSFSLNYLGIFCGALVGSIFSSDAWNNVTFTGSEINRPKRNIPLSLTIGTGSVLLLYIFINYIYIYVIPFNNIQTVQDGRVGTLLLQTTLGSFGMLLMAALIMVSTFGCINGLTLSGARVYYAMAKDGLFFKRAATLNNKQVPQFALICQAVWTSLLTLTGSYSNLLDYVVIAVLIFYILTVAAIFVFRKRKKNQVTENEYQVPGYPFTPLLYLLMALIICVNLVIFKPTFTLTGILLVIAGVPVFYGTYLKK
jgi:APA family basic amino acid/polyamine antiporter